MVARIAFALGSGDHMNPSIGSYEAGFILLFLVGVFKVHCIYLVRVYILGVLLGIQEI